MDEDCGAEHAAAKISKTALDARMGIPPSI
jgi:hypothetical protein